jgi:hypothetical protein
MWGKEKQPPIWENRSGCPKDIELIGFSTCMN